MEHRIREQLGKPNDVLVSDVVLKLLGVLRPRLCPQFFNMSKRDGADGVLIVTVTNALFKVFRMFFLGRKILLCKEPVAIEVSGAVGKLRVSPSRWMWVASGGDYGEGEVLLEG